MVELRSLAYFVTACQHESLARAAEHLGIALSTLSVSLKALEDELGLELFRRTSPGFIPRPRRAGCFAPPPRYC